MTIANDQLVGRGNRDGAALFRDWFTELSQTAEAGEQSAYVFVMGSLNEILKTFDLPVVFPEAEPPSIAIEKFNFLLIVI